MNSIANFAAEVIEAKPPISKVAQEQNQENSASVSDSESETETISTPTMTLRDSKNVAFDSSIHSVDSDGKPKTNKDGSWTKKRGRKSGHTSVTGGLSVHSGLSQTSQRNAHAAGKSTAAAIFTIGQGLFGPDWKPEKDEEIYMIDAWAYYYESTGRTELPPWLTVVIACGSYAGPRLHKPETQSRMKKLFGGLFKKKNVKKKETASA